MNILVCVKHVPDTETRVKLAPGGTTLDLCDANWVMSPYDEYAVEAALQAKEKLGGEVTLLTVGGEEAVKTLRQALAMGADKAVLCADPVFEGSDAGGTARVLCAAARKLPFDLILCGKTGVGDDNQQVGSLLAAMLEVPAVTVVTGLDLTEPGAVRCEREIEGGSEVVRCPLPVVITCQKGLNEPRYPSLKGIMAAKKKEVLTWKAADLALDGTAAGSSAAAFRLKGYELPPPRPSGRILSGEADAQLDELVRLLREEAKVI
jgi:electron transfer flavoprotein beta subunit